MQDQENSRCRPGHIVACQPQLRNIPPNRGLTLPGASDKFFSAVLPRRLRSLAEVVQRTLAVASAALVVALAIFAASPRLHDWLHSQAGLVGSDGCAVVLFASGVSMPLGAIVALPPALAWHDTPAAIAEEIFVTSPRYLRQPERGPPVR